jgi:hypothetical protein
MAEKVTYLYGKWEWFIIDNVCMLYNGRESNHSQTELCCRWPTYSHTSMSHKFLTTCNGPSPHSKLVSAGWNCRFCSHKLLARQAPHSHQTVCSFCSSSKQPREFTLLRYFIYLAASNPVWLEITLHMLIKVRRVQVSGTEIRLN